MHGRLDGADAADVRQRHEHAEELLAGVDDPPGIGTQELEMLPVGGEVADRARHARQLLRPDHDERDHADHHQLGKPYVEHRTLENKKAPAQAPDENRGQSPISGISALTMYGKSGSDPDFRQAFCSVLPLTSPSIVLPVTCGALGEE